MDNCKCGKLAHVVYNGMCEDCWLESSALTKTNRIFGKVIMDKIIAARKPKPEPEPNSL